jgi:alkanesulfonate monooxygenase SsuD/methylene tetrahydromethanopterin reductase-like flavin-dependent oxidoreductase (luciferase family)
VTFRGEYVTIHDVEFRPTPVLGRVPIWVAGGWPGSAPFRRAARFEGVWPVASAGGYLSVDEFAECVETVRGHRSEAAVDGPFDACFVDRSPSPTDAETHDKVARLAEVGMTWWIDSLDDPAVPFEQHRRRVLAGPPT